MYFQFFLLGLAKASELNFLCRKNRIRNINYMKVLLLSLILCLFTLTTATYHPKLYIDTQETKYHQYDDDYDELEIICKGGSHLKNYRFKDLPYGWRQYRNKGSENKLYVPHRQIQLSVKYQISLFVDDASVEQKLEVSLQIYFYASYKVTVYVKPYGPVKELTPYEDEQIEQAVSSGDTKTLEQIFYDTFHSDYNCHERVYRTRKLFSKISLYISLYQINIREIEKGIQEKKIQIEQLRARQAELTEKKSTDSTEDFEYALDKAQSELNFLVRMSENDQKDLDQNIEEATKIREKIHRIKQVDIPKAHSELTHLQQRLKDVLWKLKEGKQDWELQKEKKWLQKEIAWIKGEIKSYEKEISSLQDHLNWINVQIGRLRSLIEERKTQIWGLKNKISELQRKIKNSSGYGSQILRELRYISKEINDLENKIRRQEYYTLLYEFNYKKLENILRNFRRELDQEYYEKCLSVEIEIKIGQNSEYELYLPATSLQVYINYVFGSISIGIAIKVKYSVIDVDIYSPSWVLSYGYPYTYTYGDNSFKTEFICEADSYEKRKGVVKDISKDRIYVINAVGEHETLYVGVCSHLQSITGGLPKPGDNILYKVRPHPNDHTYWNVHSALFF